MDGAFTVHRTLGPGFRERIYERAYCLELGSRGLRFETEKPILVKYKQWEIPGQKWTSSSKTSFSLKSKPSRGFCRYIGPRSFPISRR
jgi:hypothetical protein